MQQVYYINYIKKIYNLTYNKKLKVAELESNKLTDLDLKN